MKQRKKEEIIQLKDGKYHIGIVELGNKSRQGLHIYIKKEKEKGRYYKYVGGELREYLNVYKKSKSKKETHEEKIRIKERAKRRMKNPKTQKEQEIKGIIRRLEDTRTTIENVYTTTNEAIEERIRGLFEEVSTDPEVIKIITQENNLEKLKHRITIRANMELEENGKVELEKTGVSIRQTIKELQEIIKEKVAYKLQGTPDHDEIGGNEVRKLGWTTKESPRRSGNRQEITRIGLEIIFSK